MGRPGLVVGTRELIEYPYIIVCEVDSDRGEISVLTILHGARDRGDRKN
jgi:plasmid stabilization system protein ParE